MQAILISITIGAFMAVSAFATGENIPTSKNYVDTEIAPKQAKIAANDGTTQVLTNTGTSGEYGTKNIYDSTASYGGQSDALIDAVTMNTAVQNAIDSEFQCAERIDPNDSTSECILFKITGADIGIQKGGGEWFRAYLNYETPTRWQYIEDASSSIRIPIKPNVEYKLYWDGEFSSSIYRVAFVKTDTAPSTSNRYINVYKPDGTAGAAFRSTSTSMPTYTFTVTDSDIKYLVVQIAGLTAPWTTEDFSLLWNRISHLHLVKTNYVPSEQNNDQSPATNSN